MDDGDELLSSIWKTDKNEGYCKARSTTSNLMLNEIKPNSKNICKKNNNNYGKTHIRNFV